MGSAACSHENPPRAKFCQQCGARLEIPCARCGSELPLSARFLPRLRPTGRRYGSGNAQASRVLFADVKGSMELAEQVDPEAWHGIMDRFFHLLADGGHRFEGTVNQYTADGIMALFGAPIAHEDHGQRVCYAALHLQHELVRDANRNLSGTLPVA